MAKADSLITDHIDIWTSAIKKRASQGRGSNKKIELTGIKKLRELILELAVRGQLVPQDPNDEPAAVLLEKIAAEKAQLIKDKKIKKAKVLPEIGENEKPFELPSGWEWTRLQEISSYIQRGKGPKYEDFGQVRVVSQKCIQWAGFNINPAKYVNDASLETYQEERYLQSRDLLWNSTGTGTVGRVNILENIEDKTLVADSHVTVIRTLLVNSLFIKSYIAAPGIQRRIEPDNENSLVSGSTKQVELNTNSVTCVEVPIPPLAEQHRIVTKVDELMALCDQLEQQTEDSITAHKTLVETLLATLTSSENSEAFNQSWTRIAEHFDTLFTTEHSIDQLKQTVLQLAVMGKLVPQDPNDEPASVLLEKIAAEKLRLENEKKLKTKAKEYIDSSEYYLATPLTWKFCRLGNLAKFIDYRGKTPTKLPNGVRLITAKNVKFGHISLQPEEFISKEEYISWMTRGIPRVGDILFTPEAPLGNIAIINIEEKFALAQRAICFQFHEKNLSKFLKIVIMSISFQNQLIKNASGMTATGIKASKLKEIPIPIPPLLEQHRIVKKVDELITLCDQLKARLSAAQTTQLQLADTLVKQAVN